MCHITKRNATDLQTRSIYIYVGKFVVVVVGAVLVDRLFYCLFAVFAKVFGTALQLNQEGELRCSVKAPTNSNITVRHNANPITKPYSAEEFSKNCDHQPQISTSSQPLEDGFSLFSVVIHVNIILALNYQL